MIIKDKCSPAIIFIAFSLVQIIIDIFKNLYNTALIKFIVMIMFFIILNILCERGLTILSWFIVFLPFVMMTITTSLILFVFGLSPDEEKLNYTVETNGKENKSEVSDPRAAEVSSNKQTKYSPKNVNDDDTTEMKENTDISISDSITKMLADIRDTEDANKLITQTIGDMEKNDELNFNNNNISFNASIPDIIEKLNESKKAINMIDTNTNIQLNKFKQIIETGDTSQIMYAKVQLKNIKDVMIENINIYEQTIQKELTEIINTLDNNDEEKKNILLEKINNIENTINNTREKLLQEINKVEKFLVEKSKLEDNSNPAPSRSHPSGSIVSSITAASEDQQNNTMVTLPRHHSAPRHRDRSSRRHHSAPRHRNTDVNYLLNRAQDIINKHKQSN